MSILHSIVSIHSTPWGRTFFLQTIATNLRPSGSSTNMSINQNDLELNSFYLVESSEQGIIALEQLSNVEYRDAIDTSSYLFEFHYHQRRFKEVELNLDDFIQKHLN